MCIRDRGAEDPANPLLSAGAEAFEACQQLLKALNKVTNVVSSVPACLDDPPPLEAAMAALKQHTEQLDAWADRKATEWDLVGQEMVKINSDNRRISRRLGKEPSGLDLYFDSIAHSPAPFQLDSQTLGQARESHVRCRREEEERLSLIHI
eukprot:TRINITY_DN31360_c0_g2_i1.p1 TRINITY_DN31360_c0_g2~~TRINITY_DN31360_c0_g2_i1.p1  ORF type:complete len:151 (+),score=43.67 TRINITY_DN31360_c0_g2_i1:146-598(+)